MSDAFVSRFVAAPDGLPLHVRRYGSPTSAGLAVVCLPGLARNGSDFDVLARALAGDPARPRQVLALDYRGRGRSGYDRDGRNYNFGVELADVMAVLTACEVVPAVFVGTSRGGILAMLLAAARPAAIAGVILNDIGPVIDIRGLMRIKSYVGKLPQPKSFDDAAEILQRLFGTQFPKLTSEDWQDFARRTFTEHDGRIAADYDPKLAVTLAGIDPARPLPPLWREFEALARVPLMVVRGANSDLLALAMVADMQARHPDLEFIEVPNQGHAPLLAEPEIIQRIGAFVVVCERRRRH